MYEPIKIKSHYENIFYLLFLRDPYGKNEVINNDPPLNRLIKNNFWKNPLKIYRICIGISKAYFTLLKTF